MPTVKGWLDERDEEVNPGVGARQLAKQRVVAIQTGQPGRFGDGDIPAMLENGVDVTFDSLAIGAAIEVAGNSYRIRELIQLEDGGLTEVVLGS